jgi:hypothetical protein
VAFAGVGVGCTFPYARGIRVTGPGIRFAWETSELGKWPSWLMVHPVQDASALPHLVQILGRFLAGSAGAASVTRTGEVLVAIGGIEKPPESGRAVRSPARCGAHLWAVGERGTWISIH